MFKTTKILRIPENTPVPPPEDDATTQKTGTAAEAEAASDDSGTDIACSDSDYEQGDSDLEFAAEYCARRSIT